MNWKEKIILNAIDFFKKINGDVAIIYGHDCDSIASGCIIFKLAQKMSLKPKLFVSKYNFEVDFSILKRVEKYKNIVIVDIGDTPEDILNNFSIGRNVLVIDHHIPKNYKLFYVNPRLIKKNVYMPASYVCWLIFKKFFDDKEILWIAGFGTLGDFGAKENKDLFLKIKKYDKKLINNLKIEDRTLIEKSLLGKIVKMVDSCRIFGGLDGIKYVTKLICVSKNYEKILKDRKIKNFFNKLKKEMKKEIENVHKNAIIVGNYLIYELKSKYNLKSSLASFLPKLYKDKIIFIAQKNKEGFYEVSVRRGLKLKTNLSLLVKKICENISAKGGGHPTAAGMRIDKIEELIEWLKKRKKKESLSS